MLVHWSNCEMGYGHESITHLDIGLVTDCNHRWLFQPKQSLGCTIDGKSTGSRRRQRDCARPPSGADAQGLTVTNVIELTNNGAGDRFRTDDLVLGKHALYQLSYTRSPSRQGELIEITVGAMDVKLSIREVIKCFARKFAKCFGFQRGI